MKKSKLGFTLIEVALFLAVTGALFVSIAVGVQQSIYQQRQNDAVNSFIEFLRSAYAGVTNVQNTGGGRSDQAIYGKLITFGETHNLAGDEINGGNPGNEVFMYTVKGNIREGNANSGSDSNADIIDLLRNRGVNILNETEGDNPQWEYAGIAESYTPKWATEIQAPCEPDATIAQCNFTPLQASILIVRHPTTGTIYTLYAGTTIQVNATVKESKERRNISSADGPLKPFLDSGVSASQRFQKFQQIDFCINTTGENGVANRPDVRIESGAKNSSAINTVSADMEDYRCGR